MQLARAAAQMSSLAEFDEILTGMGPTSIPRPATPRQLTGCRGRNWLPRSRRSRSSDDVDVRDLGLLNVSPIFETSFVVNEIDPALWFDVVRDEANIRYAVAPASRSARPRPGARRRSR